MRVAHHSGLRDRLLRPLSAKMLVATLPEREGWVDREQLYGFYGRGRRGLIQLAKSLGIDEIPTPSTGCVLTEPPFSRKVFDLLRHQPHNSMWDFELLKHGRHFRFNDQCKVVIGRREAENNQLGALARFAGSRRVGAAVAGRICRPDWRSSSATSPTTPSRLPAQLIQRFAKNPSCLAGRVRVTCGAEVRYLAPVSVDELIAAKKNVADA